MTSRGTKDNHSTLPQGSTCLLQCIHHGAAAASVAQAVTWIPNHDKGIDADETNNDNNNNSSLLVYASHAVVHIVSAVNVSISGAASNHNDELVWQTVTTLRTRQREGDIDLQITALAMAKEVPASSATATTTHPSIAIQCPTAIVTGYSNGSVSVWIRPKDDENNRITGTGQEEQEKWQEHVLVGDTETSQQQQKQQTASIRRSITAIAATWYDANTLSIVTGSSDGATYYQLSFQTNNNNNKTVSTIINTQKQCLTTSAMKSVAIVPQQRRQQQEQEQHSTDNIDSHGNNHGAKVGLWVLLGTAAPRHNRIQVYTTNTTTVANTTANPTPPQDATTDPTKLLLHAGGLSGHQDWITCIDFNHGHNMLATGSQDGRIRLWRFVATTINTATAAQDNKEQKEPKIPVWNDTTNDDGIVVAVDSDPDDDDDDDKAAEEEEQAGEARLEIQLDDNSQQPATTTIHRVFLEAILFGHEEMVTAVTWHPDPKDTYGEDLLLISSSMDRSILLWTPSTEDGIWTPLTRVGSAGGILGGSVGSTLLGYLSVSLDPLTGTTLVGHAYGGSLHTWRLDDTKLKEKQRERQSTPDPEPLTTEDRASLVHWRAKPCVTGHFRGVVDLAWETYQGSYLLSVSADQTCRLWAPVGDDNDKVWVELGRPQVHGYDLTAVASLSTPSNPHLLVTAGDEKELRVFDAPKATIDLLQHTAGVKHSPTDTTERVERAYIPSLGLSNKASAAESAEEEKPQGDAEEMNSIVAAPSANGTSKFYLPLERDLGAVSLWPEIRKLFGHQTELFCLTSTLAAQTSASSWDPSKPVLLASSCKARNVSDAAIRLWNVSQGKCHQILQGGHKATVATLAFSPCGTYLASSGKDRRLCIWKRGVTIDTQDKFTLAWAQDSAHKRIIWSVHFCPWQPTCFVSGSRDGCIKVWQLHSSSEDDHDNKTTAAVLHSFAPKFSLHGKPDAVTALSLRPTPYQSGVALLAVGLESGNLEVWTIPTLAAADAGAAVPMCLTSNQDGHRATITKLAWKPQRDASSSTELLASSSMDHGVRIWRIQC